MEKKKWMAICLTAITINATAQDADTTKNLNEVIVSATRSEKNTMDVGRSVTILKSEDFKKGNYQSLGEVLNTIDGIYISGSQMNAGSNQTVFTRGTNSNHTVVMIDGVRITDPSGINNAIDLSEISLSNIEQIEIVKGAHSTLYGSAAIGGVINIITRKPKEGLSVAANVNAGSFGKNTFTNSNNLYLNYGYKGWFLGGEIYYQNTRGFDATEDTMVRENITKLFDTDDFTKLDYNLKGGFKNEKTYGYFSFKKSNQFTETDKLYQGTSKYYNPWGSNPEIYYDGNYSLDFNRQLLTYGIQHKFNDKFSVNYYGGYTKMQRSGTDDSTEILQNVYDKVYYRGDYEGRVLSNELQANIKLKGMELTMGASHYSENMLADTKYKYYSDWTMMYDSIISSLDTISPELSSVSGYLQTELNGSLIDKEFEKFNLILGMRFNSYNLSTLVDEFYFENSQTGINDVFKNQFNYTINPFIKPDENTILFFSYSTGFNAPSLYQLFSPESNYQSLITRGNPFLKPETSISLEAGIKKKINNQYSFGISLFSNTIENMIEYVYLWNKNVGLDTLGNDWMRDDYFGDTYINLGTMKNRGLEFTFEGKINSKLTVAANVSLISGTLEYDPMVIDTVHTDNHHIQLYSNGEFISENKNSSILSRRPSTANFRIKYMPFTDLSVELISQFTDNRYDAFYNSSSGPYGALNLRPLEAYQLFHVNINYKYKEQFNFNLRVENITDTQYNQITGFRTRGRSFYFGINFNL